MEDIKQELPKHIKQSIDRHESIATKLNEEIGDMLSNEGDPVKIEEDRYVLAEEKFAHQRMAEHIRSEFGLPPKHRVARQQIEERKVKV